jgi:hypothetical protein
VSEVKSALGAVEMNKHLSEGRVISARASGVVLTFNSEDLTELCDIARKMQDLLGALRPYGTYDLHGIYDEDTECWTGVLEEIS